MTVEQRSFHPEAIAAYQNDAVVKAIQNSDWLTPDFIAAANETFYPEREGLGSFNDPLLGDFLMLCDGSLPDAQIYSEARAYLRQGIVSHDGHPFRLGGIPFFNDEVNKLAMSLGTTENHEFDRMMVGKFFAPFACMIAPKKIRAQVSRVTMTWREGYIHQIQDVLLMSELVKRGAKKYLEETGNIDSGSSPE